MSELGGEVNCGESRDVLIKHLKMELDELKNSSRKFNELYEVLVSLEESYKILKEEKKRNEEDQKYKAADQVERISEATNELRGRKSDFQTRNGEVIDIRNRVDRLRQEVEHKEAQEISYNDKIVDLGRALAQNNELKHHVKSSCDESKREISNLRNSSLICERDLIKMEEKIARAEQEKVNRENSLVTLESEFKFIDQTKEEHLNKRNELTNNINKQQSEINKHNARFMERDNNQSYIKQEINKIRNNIGAVEKKRHDEKEITEDLHHKLNHMQLDTKKLDDNIFNSERLVNELNSELSVQNDKKIEQNRENREYKELLSKLQCQNSTLVAQLETLQRENEECIYMLKREEDYKELKVTIGASISTAQEIVYKKKPFH